MAKYQFSGHESFTCRNLWLKKGYDFVNNEGSFTDERAVVDLGVGKNMVNSVRFWLKSFGIVNEDDTLTDLGLFLFDEGEGKDPYIETIGTVWLLHYNLIITGKSSLYNIFFNEFRRTRTEFQKEQLVTFIEKKYREIESNAFNRNTVSSDISVFIRTYLKPTSKNEKVDVEDDFSGLLIDLELMQKTTGQDFNGKLVDYFKVENEQRTDLPFHIVLFAILDNERYGKSVSFKELRTGHNSPGVIFSLNEDCLFDKITEIIAKYPTVRFSESAGIQELQFNNRLDKWDILNDYYEAI